MKFFSSFVYTILFIFKDTLIITNPELGAGAIPMLKGTVTLISAFVIALMYERIVLWLKLDKVFLFFAGFFTAFIALYAFIFYPYRDFLAFETLGTIVAKVSGSAMVGSLAKYWFDVLFFIVADLWGSFLIVTLVWGLANALTTFEQSGRFYSLITSGTHMGTLLGGAASSIVTANTKSYADSVQVLLLMAIIACIGMVTNIFMLSPRFRGNGNCCTLKEKTKLSFGQSCRSIFASKYLFCLALMVVGYGFTMNLVEIVWKEAITEIYSESKDYQTLMGNISAYLGAASLLFSILISGNIIRGLGWFVSAMICPLAISIFSVLFFICYYADSFEALKNLPVNFIYLAMVFGALHNVAAKLLKYNLFDPTKEMAFIPLPFAMKTQAKAAIDTVSSRLGKSGSSWLLIALMEIVQVTSIGDVSLYLLPFIAIGFFGWMFSIFYLGKKLEIPS